MKLATIVGALPHFIKAAAISRVLQVRGVFPRAGDTGASLQVRNRLRQPRGADGPDAGSR
jgi:hypothetical protein